MPTAFYSHAECRLHDMGAGHPECPQRLDAITDQLLASGLDVALQHRDAPLATLAQIERRLQVFFALPFGQQSPAQLLPQLLAIGELP